MGRVGSLIGFSFFLTNLQNKSYGRSGSKGILFRYCTKFFKIGKSLRSTSTVCFSPNLVFPYLYIFTAGPKFNKL